MITDLTNHSKMKTEFLAKKQAVSQDRNLEKLWKLEARDPLKIDRMRWI